MLTHAFFIANHYNNLLCGFIIQIAYYCTGGQFSNFFSIYAVTLQMSCSRSEELQKMPKAIIKKLFERSTKRYFLEFLW